MDFFPHCIIYVRPWYVNKVANKSPIGTNYARVKGCSCLPLVRSWPNFESFRTYFRTDSWVKHPVIIIRNHKPASVSSHPLIKCFNPQISYRTFQMWTRACHVIFQDELRHFRDKRLITKNQHNLLFSLLTTLQRQAVLLLRDWKQLTILCSYQASHQPSKKRNYRLVFWFNILSSLLPWLHVVYCDAKSIQIESSSSRPAKLISGLQYTINETTLLHNRLTCSQK